MSATETQSLLEVKKTKRVLLTDEQKKQRNKAYIKKYQSKPENRLKKNATSLAYYHRRKQEDPTYIQHIHELRNIARKKAARQKKLEQCGINSP